MEQIRSVLVQISDLCDIEGDCGYINVERGEIGVGFTFRQDKNFYAYACVLLIEFWVKFDE